MKIERIILYYCKFPLDFTYSWGTLTETNVCAIELRSGKHSGWGEVDWGMEEMSPNLKEEKLKQMDEKLKQMAEELIGKEITGPVSALPEIEYDIGHFNAFTLSREGLSIALYDLFGKLLGVNVSTLLGGLRRRKFPGMPVVHVGPPEQMARRAKKWVDAGYKYLKIKYSGKHEEDLERLRAIRDAVGDDILFQIDANFGYKKIDEAVKAIHDLEPFKVEIIEDFFEGELGDYARIRSAVQPKVMIDSQAYWPNILKVITLGAADIINHHPANQGGLDIAMKINAVSQSAGIPTAIGSSYDIGIGDTAFQILASVIALSRPCEDIGLSPYFTGPMAGEYKVEFDPNILKDPFPIEEGQIIIRDLPGLGVEVDRKKLENISYDSIEIK